MLDDSTYLTHMSEFRQKTNTRMHMTEDIKDKDAKYITEMVKNIIDYVKATHEFNHVFEAQSYVNAILQQALLLNSITMKLSFDEVKEALNETINTQKDHYEYIYNQIINRI